MCVPRPAVRRDALRGAESADQSAWQPVREIDMDLNTRMDWTWPEFGFLNTEDLLQFSPVARTTILYLLSISPVLVLTVSRSARAPVQQSAPFPAHLGLRCQLSLTPRTESVT